MVRCRDVGAVDMMCYLMSPEHYKKVAAMPPSAQPAVGAGTLINELGGRPAGQPAERQRRRTGYTTEQYVELMDKNGVDKSLICSVKMWDPLGQQPNWGLYCEEEEVHEWVKGAPGRMYGLAGYNPFHIIENCEKVEKAVKEFDFKGVYVHSYGYGLRVDDRKFYPLYETCVRLDVPVSMQMGHSAEAMLSEVGRPMAMDMVAIDFPRLTLIGSHTGWPWSQELIAMASKHRNVYMDVSAWPPSYWDHWLIREIDGRCRYKVMWGSNMTIARSGENFDDMDKLLTREEAKRTILRENAMRVYKL
jgi:predicted TIM-barrel fold metal-dependent hydrolase